jgi:hypothetical protein
MMLVEEGAAPYDHNDASSTVDDSSAVKKR